MPNHSLYNFLGTYNKAYKTKAITDVDFENFINKLQNFYTQASKVTKENEGQAFSQVKTTYIKNFLFYYLQNNKLL